MPTIPSAQQAGIGQGSNVTSVGRVRVGASPGQLDNTGALNSLAQGTAQVANTFGNAAVRVINRQDSASRIKALQEFQTFSQSEFDRLSVEGDLADPEQVKSFNQAMASRAAELKDAHLGSAESVAALENSLSQAAFTFENHATGEAIKAQQRVISNYLGEKVTALSGQAYDGAEDFTNLAIEAETEIANLAGSLTPDQETEYRNTLVGEIATSSLQGMIDRGELSEMEEFLQVPRVSQALPAAAQRQWQSKIGQRRRVQEEALQEGTRAVQKAAAILGVSPDELPAWVRFNIAGVTPPTKQLTKAEEIAELEKIVGPLSQPQKAKYLGVDVSGPGPLTDAGKAVQEVENFERLYGKDSEQVQELKRLQSAPNDPPDLTSIGGMRKEFTSLSKSFSTVREAYGRIKSVAKTATAASDLALIFNYMKMLDPGSTVREGEFATAQNAGGVGTRAMNIYNSLLDGTRLNEQQRDDFLGRSDDLFQSQAASQRGLEQQFSALASRAGMNPDDVVIDFFAGGETEADPAAGTPSAPILQYDGAGNPIGAAPEAAPAAAPEVNPDPGPTPAAGAEHQLVVPIPPKPRKGGPK